MNVSLTTRWLIGAVLAMAWPVCAKPPGFERVANAQPDQFVVDGTEAFYRYGSQPPGAPGYARVNHDYLWSMTLAQGAIWFGDVANAVCGDAAVRPDNPIRNASAQNNARVCDFGTSTYPGVPRWMPDAVRNLAGDWRPADIFRYQPAEGRLERKTPRDARLMTTEGFRAASANDRVVLLAGPHLYKAAINLFAFSARGGVYLGSTTLDGFANIRSFARVGEDVYAGVEDARFPFGGSVLRFRPTLADPFAFEVVGRTDAGGGYIATYEGRLFVSTWPGLRGLGIESRGLRAGLWMSPLIPAGGLRAGDASRWRKVWTIASYEPDPQLQYSYSGGALCSHGGWLYWGTMQYPGQGYETMTRAYGQVADPGLLLTNTQRAACLFRGRDFAQAPRVPASVELLYGEAQLPVFEPTSGTWSSQPAGYGAAKLGPAGFGQPGNCFVWSMAVHQGRLFIGTQDYRGYLYADALAAGSPTPPDLGGDLYALTDGTTPAMPIALDGGGNPLNHGFRNLLSDGVSLYAGTASISNLETLPSSGLRGGWSLLRWRSP